jgi:hypothetical protein
MMMMMMMIMMMFWRVSLPQNTSSRCFEIENMATLFLETEGISSMGLLLRLSNYSER